MAWLKKYWWIVALIGIAGLLYWVVKKTGQTVSAVFAAPGEAVKAAWQASKAAAGAVTDAVMSPETDPIAAAAAAAGAATSDWHPIDWLTSKF